MEYEIDINILNDQIKERRKVEIINDSKTEKRERGE